MATKKKGTGLMMVWTDVPFRTLAEFPVMKPGGDAAAEALWHQLSSERDRYLDGVDTELTKRSMSGTSAP